MNRNIIITGATSYIAVELIKIFAENHDTVYAVVRPNSSNRYKIPCNNYVKIVEVDMAEINRLKELVPREIDALYHFAWEGMRGEARNDERLQMYNYSYSKVIFEMAIDMQIRLVVGSGSQAEYGIKTGLITEEDIPEPVCEYGKAKLRTFYDGLRLYNNSESTFVWTRIFSVYGTGDFAGSLIMSTIEKMLKNESVFLSPCHHRWNFLYCQDLANALWLFSVRKVSSGVYNLASEDTRILKDYIYELRDILNSSSELLFGAYPYTTKGCVGISPDITKVKKILQWSPGTSFHDGIKHILEKQVV